LILGDFRKTRPQIDSLEVCMLLRLITALTTLILCSCANVPNQVLVENTPEEPKLEISSLPSDMFGGQQEIIDTDLVYELTPEQKSHFLGEFNSSEYRSTPKHRRIYKYLESYLESFKYYEETFVAKETLNQNRGNCLSLAILTKALSDLVDIEADYQLVQTTPVYQKESNLIVSSQHIRTVLYKPETESNGWTFLRSRIIIDYFPDKRSRILRSVDEAEFRSLYFTNKAVESMIENDNNKAYWYLDQSLALKPDHNHALNTLGLLYGNAGYKNYAEQVFKYGIQNTEEDLNLLNNYHSLLVTVGRYEEAEEIKKEIGSRNDSNPFKWVKLGDDAYNAREYSKAIGYYRKASKLAPYLHETYAGIARSNFQLGKPSRALKAIKVAMTNANKNDVRDLYQTKYDLLTELLAKK